MRSNRYYRLVDEVAPEVKAQRERIAQDTAAFLAAGGKVEQVPRGFSKYSDVSISSIRMKLDKTKRFGEA